MTLPTQALALTVLVACARPPPDISVAAPQQLSLTSCPTLPAGISIKAHVLIAGVSDPCELDVTTDASGDLSASGDCPNIPARQEQLVIDWYVTGPTSGKDVVLAEFDGALSLAPSSAKTVTVSLPGAVPKTLGAATDAPSERDRFNCDRSGTYGCDGDVYVDPNAADIDTCSNLEELCMNTLFIPNHIDLCP